MHIAAVRLLEVGYSARSAQKPAGHRCGFIEYADRVLAEKEGAKMRESVMWVMLVPDKGAMDAKFTVEQG